MVLVSRCPDASSVLCWQLYRLGSERGSPAPRHPQMCVTTMRASLHGRAAAMLVALVAAIAAAAPRGTFIEAMRSRHSRAAGRQRLKCNEYAVEFWLRGTSVDVLRKQEEQILQSSAARQAKAEGSFDYAVLCGPKGENARRVKITEMGWGEGDYAPSRADDRMCVKVTCNKK